MRPLYAILVSLLLAVSLSAQQDSVRVWPGDANNNGAVNEVDVLYWGAAFGRTGPPRSPIDVLFVGYPFNPWNITFWNGVDYAHADCNGDGEVNDLD